MDSTANPRVLNFFSLNAYPFCHSPAAMEKKAGQSPDALENCPARLEYDLLHRRRRAAVTIRRAAMGFAIALPGAPSLLVLRSVWTEGGANPTPRATDKLLQLLGFVIPRIH